MRQLLIDATYEALAGIAHPPFFATERGYQGAFYSALRTILDRQGLLSDGRILEQEHQKGRAHNMSQRPDIILHIRREMQSLDAKQALSFLEAAQRDRWHAFWVLLLTSGLRPGEALALKWSDVEGDRVHVQRALVRQDGAGWKLAEPKTARARRVVSLPAGMLLVLQCGKAWADLDLLFATRTGQPLDYRLIVQRHFKPLLHSAKVPSIRPYDLRHSCATLLLAAGENVKVVSERLGDASVTITLDNYAHVLPDMQQGATDRLKATLFPSRVTA